jgi:hypothetical protein
MPSLTRLKITRSKPDMSIDKTPSATFAVMLNPGSVKHGGGIRYNKTEALGSSKVEAKFSSVGEETLSFSLLMDGTGVVPGSSDVPAQLKALRSVVYQYVDTQHEPSRVQVVWGKLVFFGRLSQLETEYTLFKPDGEPLRAKLSLAFIGSTSKEIAQLQAGQSSANCSRVVEVRDGDTLPLLCQRIYGDDAYYLDVARFNRLPNLRHLTPGTTLQFPPLA